MTNKLLFLGLLFSLITPNVMADGGGDGRGYGGGEDGNRGFYNRSGENGGRFWPFGRRNNGGDNGNNRRGWFGGNNGFFNRFGRNRGGDG